MVSKGCLILGGRDYTILRGPQNGQWPTRGKCTIRATMAISSWNFSDISPQQETQKNKFDPYMPWKAPGNKLPIVYIYYIYIYMIWFPCWVGRCRTELSQSIFITIHHLNKYMFNIYLSTYLCIYLFIYLFIYIYIDRLLACFTLRIFEPTAGAENIPPVTHGSNHPILACGRLLKGRD